MKPPKKVIVTDTFEHFKDVGREVTRETGKAFSLDNFLTGLYGASQEKPQEGEQPEQKDIESFTKKEQGKKPTNNTPLDLDALRRKHHKSKDDEKALEAIRNRLFKNVKSEEQQAQNYFKQQKDDKAKEEDIEKRQKVEDIKQKQANQQSADIPQGKAQRGGLFAKKRKKVATDENRAEFRGSGKH